MRNHKDELTGYHEDTRIVNAQLMAGRRVSGSIGALCTVGAAVLVTASILQLPVSYAVAATFAAAMVLILALLPPTWTLGIWGFLLPIWAVPRTEPAYFDAARVLVTILIVVRSMPQNSEHPGGLWKAKVLSWVAPILALGTIVLFLSLAREDSRGIPLGRNMIIAALIVCAVLFCTRDVRSVLAGYFVGVTASASILILQALKIADLSPQDAPGYFRATGLAPSSTLVSIELAIGLILGLSALGAGRRLARISMVPTALIFIAILLSGGRVGVAGLLVSLLLAAFAGWIRLYLVVVLGALIAVAIWIGESLGIDLFTLDRLLNGSPQSMQTDYGSGRAALNGEAIDSIRSNWLEGSTLDQFVNQNGASPHSPVLVFGVVAGVAGLILCVCLTIRILYRMARRPAVSSATARSCYLILGVLFASIILEPDGAFVGVQMNFMLIASMCVLGEGEAPSITVERESARDARESALCN